MTDAKRTLIFNTFLKHPEIISELTEALREQGGETYDYCLKIQETKERSK